MSRKHHLHSFLNRSLYSLMLAFSILSVGTVCMHELEGFSFVDAFYFTSMIATGQGPAPSIYPATTAGKLFTCLLAFVSTGAMIASLGFLFGPLLGMLWKIGITKFEEELEHLKGKK